MNETARGRLCAGDNPATSSKCRLLLPESFGGTGRCGVQTETSHGRVKGGEHTLGSQCCTLGDNVLEMGREGVASPLGSAEWSLLFINGFYLVGGSPWGLQGGHSASHCILLCCASQMLHFFSQLEDKTHLPHPHHQQKPCDSLYCNTLFMEVGRNRTLRISEYAHMY